MCWPSRTTAPGSPMPDDHHPEIIQLTTDELERTRRELAANLALVRPGSPARAPIQAQMAAIDAELAARDTPHLKSAERQNAELGAGLRSGGLFPRETYSEETPPGDRKD